MDGNLLIDSKRWERKKTLFAGIFLATIVLLVYWPVQDYDFINFDDRQYVIENKGIQEGFTARSVASAFTDISTSNWHPLTLLSHMLDWSLYGSMAGGHHWTSVVIHCGCTVLLFLFLRSATGALGRSAFVAALFAVHPINVDSVAWIAERKNVLSAFFWMAALCFYVRYCRAPGWKRALPVFICFALGLMSKPMAVTLPFVLLLLDYWPLNRLHGYPEIDTGAPVFKKETVAALVREKLPLFALSALSAAVTIYAAQSSGAIASLDKIPLDKRLANVAVSYVLYIKQMLWPFEFSIFYPFNFHIPAWQSVSAAALLAAVTVLICTCGRKVPYLPVGWFWYLGVLAPVIGIIHVGRQSMADRYAYIPFIGLFLIGAWWPAENLKKLVSPKIQAVAALGIIVFLMFLAQGQLRHWQNTETLYRNVIRVAAEHPLPYKGLAMYLINNKRPQEAIPYFEKAIALAEDDHRLHNSLGVAYDVLGKRQDAEKEYLRALQLNPAHAPAHNNLGLLYLRQSKYDNAIKHLREAVSLRPDLVGAHFYLAEVLKQKGFGKEAAFHYKAAGRLDSHDRRFDLAI